MDKFRRIFAPRGTRIAAASSAAILALITMLMLSQNAPHPPKTVATDLSGRPTACLAADTGTAGQGDTVTKVWAAMQQGAAKRRVNIQQLVIAAADARHAQPYLAGLIERRCTLVITVGASFGQAIPASTRMTPSIRFAAVAAGLTTVPARTTILAPADAPSAVRQQVQSLATTSQRRPGS